MKRDFDLIVYGATGYTGHLQDLRGRGARHEALQRGRLRFGIADLQLLPALSR